MTARRYYVPAPLGAMANASRPAPPPPPPAAGPPHVPTAVPNPAPWSLPPPPGQTWATPPHTTPPVGPPVDGHERWWRRMPKPLLIAAILAAVAWVVRVSVWTKSTHNGVVTSCSYLDVGAVALGGTTILLSVWGALATVLDKRPNRLSATLLLALAALTLTLGFVHVFRGLDIVMPQCPKIGSIDTSTGTGL